MDVTVGHGLLLTWVPASDLSRYHTSWVSPPELLALKLEYSSAYQVFRCMRCMTVSNRKAPKGCIHPADLDKHVHTFHDCKRCLEDIQEEINTIFSNYPPHQGRHPMIPLFPHGILPPAIPDVAQEIGFYCTLCRQVRKGEKKDGYARLVTHCHKEHPGSSAHSVIQKGTVQALYRSGTSTFYFPVNRSYSEEEVRPLEQAYQQDSLRVGSMHDAAFCHTFDPRDRSPLLTKLKWDVLLQDIPPESILSLVCNPTKDEPLFYEDALKVWITDMFMEINNYLEKNQNSPLLQQVMYLGYERDVVSDKRMRSLKDKTVGNYSRLFFRLILFLIRYRTTQTHPKMELNLTSAQKREIHWLLNILWDSDYPDRKRAGQRHLLALGYSLLQTSTVSLKYSPWDEIIYKFLVYTSVRKGGVFEEAGNIAPRVTRLLWLFRSVVIEKVRQELKEFNGSPEEMVE